MRTIGRWLAGALLLSAWGARADTSTYMVRPACGGESYTSGQNRQGLMDPTGRICDSGGGGGGGSNASVGTNGVTAPTSSTQIGISVGGVLQPVSASNPVPISGSITATLSGFTPNGVVANLAATTSSASVALPSGTVVAVTNAGSNTVHIKLSVGSGSAATTDYALLAGNSIGLTVGSNTFINAITDTGSSALSLAGGQGLLTGFGGGQASSGGGTASVNLTQVGGAAVALGSTTSSASLPVVIASDQAAVSVKQATAANLNATVVGTGTFAVQNTTATPAGTNLIGKVGIDQTTPGTTNGVQTLSGSTTGVTQATAANLNAQVQGTAASGASNAGNPVKIGGPFNSTQPNVASGQIVDGQFTARGAEIVAPGVDGFPVTIGGGSAVIGHVITDSGSTTAATQSGAWNIANITGTVSLPTGAATAANQPTNATAGSSSAGETGNMEMAAVTTASPSYTTGQTNYLSLTTAGALRTDASATTQPISAASLPLPTGASTAANQTSVQAPVAPATATATKANAAAGRYHATPDAVTDGQEDEAQMGPHGEGKVCPVDSTGACADPTLAVPVTQWPSSSANAAPLHNQVTTASSNLVVVTGSHNLYGLNVAAGASALYIMIFDATTAPADGTVTPVKVYQVAINSSFSIPPSNVPLIRCTTGIVIVTSTTGPFTKTASATAFISGDYE